MLTRHIDALLSAARVCSDSGEVLRDALPHASRIGRAAEDLRRAALALEAAFEASAREPRRMGGRDAD